MAGGGVEARDEPVTPAGRFFLQPEIQQVINCAIGIKNPVDVTAVKAEIKRTLLRYHPRFSCILVRDGRGREHWRPLPEIDLEKHVIIVPQEEDEKEDEEGRGAEGMEEENEQYVNEYVAGLTVSAPLGTDKPLWEVHVLPPRRRCCVLRLHHALGDGVSLVSLFLACCERADDPSLPISIPGAGGGGNRRGKLAKRVRVPLVGQAWRAVLVAWYTVAYSAAFVAYSLWAKDGKTVITGGAGVEEWPRRLVGLGLSLDDMKAVKRTVNGTINDVLLGVISCGLAKYFKLHSPKETSKITRLTGLALVNTRQSPGLQDLSNMMKKNSKARWGNQIGYVLLPIYLHESIRDPLEYVKRAKAMIDRKKLSLEAHFSYNSGALIMSLFGPKVATLLNYRIVSHTSFSLSNVVGPLEEIMFAKNPITYLRPTSNSLPHALTIHMATYMGKADMQILVAKDIINDPEVLAGYFKEALNEMKMSSLRKM